MIPKMGRPFSALTPAIIERERLRMAKAKPGAYVITRRANELGVKSSTLSYHLRNGYEAKCGVITWRKRISLALRTANKGNNTLAAKMLREAADILDSQ